MALAETAQLIVDLRLQDGLSTGVAKVKTELTGLQGTLASANTSLGSLSASFGNLIKIGVGSFAAFKIVDVLKDSVQAALEEETSIARLTASLKANDVAWDGNRASIEAVLQSRMRLGHSDDEQRESLSRIVAATHDVAKALDVERVAMDLAAFKGVSLADASTALVTVEAGRYRGLAQLGIQIKANATQEEALAAVQKVVAGSAEALANTTQGRLTAANVKLGEALEKLGGVILPPLAAGMGLLADAFEVVGNNIQAVLPVAETLLTLIGVRAITSFATAAAGMLGLGTAATVAAGQLELFATAELGAATAATTVGTAAVAAETKIAALGATGAAVSRLLGPLALLFFGLQNDDKAATQYGLSIKGLEKLTDEWFAKTGNLATGLDVQAVATYSARDAMDSEAAAAFTLAHNLDALEGTISDTRSSADKLAAGLHGTGETLDTVTGRADAAKEGVAGAKGAVDNLAVAIQRLRDQADAKEIDVFAQAIYDAEKAGLTLAESLGKVAGQAQDDISYVDKLSRSLDNIPRNVAVTITVTTIATSAGSNNVEEKTTFPKDPQNAADFDRQQQEREAERQRQADEAKRKADADAARAASEAQAAAQRRVSASYDDTRTAADRLFDSLHDRHIKAIEDAEKLAQTQHDGAIQRINDALTAQEAENRKPANQAEAAQTEREQAESRRNLVESLQAAQAAIQKNRDPKQAESLAIQLRSATEALANFDAHAAIDRLNVVADARDKTAEDAAKKARDKADADLEAAKLQAAASETLVNAQDKKKKEDFDRALAALKEKDKNDPAKFLQDSKALQARFGIFEDDRGFRHIGDVIGASIKGLKLEPKVTVSLHPSFVLKLGAVELRGIASAIAANAQPAGTPPLRSGTPTR